MSRESDDRTAQETRLLNLEEKVAYQDKIIAELNDVVVSLNRMASALDARLRGLENALQSDLGARDVPNERPPHY